MIGKSLKVLSLALVVSAFISSESVAEAVFYDAEGGGFTVNGADQPGSMPPGMRWQGTGRMDIGWGGDGGGNLAAYSKTHASRPGEFNFVFGGGPELGRVFFKHYNGTGWQNKMSLDKDGNLTVAGSLNSTEVKVTESVAWPDYVFKDGYDLMPLSDLSQYLKKNGHLPGMPTSSDVAKEGIRLGEVSAKLLEKIEELTIHVIELKKQNDLLEAKLEMIQ